MLGRWLRRSTDPTCGAVFRREIHKLFEVEVIHVDTTRVDACPSSMYERCMNIRGRSLTTALDGLRNRICTF